MSWVTMSTEIASAISIAGTVVGIMLRMWSNRLVPVTAGARFVVSSGWDNALWLLPGELQRHRRRRQMYRSRHSRRPLRIQALASW